MERIAVLIADDHPLFRFGLRARLGAEPDLAVVGEAGSGEEALDLAADLAPDVVLMDLNLPGMNGIEATRLLRVRAPAIAVLVVTMFEDDSVFAAMRAGARGYLLKDADAEETVRAIRAVANGEAIFSPSVARRLMGFFASPSATMRPRHTSSPNRRSRRMRELSSCTSRSRSSTSWLFSPVRRRTSSRRPSSSVSWVPTTDEIAAKRRSSSAMSWGSALAARRAGRSKTGEVTAGLRMG